MLNSLPCVSQAQSISFSQHPEVLKSSCSTHQHSS